MKYLICIFIITFTSTCYAKEFQVNGYDVTVLGKPYNIKFIMYGWVEGGKKCNIIKVNATYWNPKSSKRVQMSAYTNRKHIPPSQTRFRSEKKTYETGRYKREWEIVKVWAGCQD